MIRKMRETLTSHSKKSIIGDCPKEEKCCHLSKRNGEIDPIFVAINLPPLRGDGLYLRIKSVSHAQAYDEDVHFRRRLCLRRKWRDRLDLQNIRQGGDRLDRRPVPGVWTAHHGK